VAILDGDAVARRHSPVVRSVDRFAPLSVGNGRFAFTVDATGLQTLADYYGERSGAGRYRGIPLGTQSEWGWHTAPNPRGYSIETFPLTRIETHGRPIDYLVGDRERDPSARWLYGNPHRLQLGWLKFDFGDGPVSAETIESVDQILDLGEGVIRSRFAYRGLPVSV